MSKLTNKQHTDYCEIINNFKCKAIDILEELTKEYKDTLTEDIDKNLNDYKTHNEELIIKVNQQDQQIAELKSRWDKLKEWLLKDRVYFCKQQVLDKMQELENKDE